MKTPNVLKSVVSEVWWQLKERAGLYKNPSSLLLPLKCGRRDKEYKLVQFERIAGQIFGAAVLGHHVVLDADATVLVKLLHL